MVFSVLFNSQEIPSKLSGVLYIRQLLKRYKYIQVVAYPKIIYPYLSNLFKLTKSKNIVNYAN